MSVSAKHFGILPTSMETSKPTCIRFENSKMEYTPWVYLHGSLESSAASQGGWDKFKWLENGPTSEGIHNCVAIVTENVVVEATAFLWKSSFDKLTGLVVADDDTESMLYALKKYKAKSDCI